MAAHYGEREILDYLLELGVDVAAPSGMSALHQAAGRADLDIVKLLIERGAPLEMKNAYGGTVLDSTLWFAYHVTPAEFASRDYPAVIDALIAAGARTDLYPEMEKYIDEVYRKAEKKRR
jgi:ankyrin repeat protein